MKALFLGAFPASQVEWIAPVIESPVELEILADDSDSAWTDGMARRRGADSARNIDRFIRGEMLANIAART